MRRPGAVADVHRRLRARLRTTAEAALTGLPDAARRLAALRVDTRLKLPGCCVLLAAQDAGADTVATFDDRLGAAAEGLGISVA